MTMNPSDVWKSFLWFLGIATAIITAVKLVPKLWRLLVGAARFIAAIDKVTPVLAKLGFEMSNNGGSSMKDKLEHTARVADEALRLVKHQGVQITRLHEDGEHKRRMLQEQNEVLDEQNRVLAAHRALMDKIETDIHQTQQRTVDDLKAMLDRRVVLHREIISEKQRKLPILGNANERDDR